MIHVITFGGCFISMALLSLWLGLSFGARRWLGVREASRAVVAAFAECNMRAPARTSGAFELGGGFGDGGGGCDGGGDGGCH